MAITLLPVRLPDGAQGGAIDQCVIAANHPPAPTDIERLTQCRRVNPDDPQLASDLGDLLTAAGRPADAEAAYRAAVTLAPDNASAQSKLARALQQRGAVDDARAHAAIASRLQPNNPSVTQLMTDLGAATPQ